MTYKAHHGNTLLHNGLNKKYLKVGGQQLFSLRFGLFFKMRIIIKNSLAWKSNSQNLRILIFSFIHSIVIHLYFHLIFICFLTYPVSIGYDFHNNELLSFFLKTIQNISWYKKKLISHFYFLFQHFEHKANWIYNIDRSYILKLLYK